MDVLQSVRRCGLEVSLMISLIMEMLVMRALLLLCFVAANAFVPAPRACFRSGSGRSSLIPRSMSSGESVEGPLVLTYENAELAVDATKKSLTTLFGYAPENREVGITGELELADVDGMTVLVRLKGKFWHDRRMVLERVSKFITNLIPECVVEVEDAAQLEGGDDAKSTKDFYADSLF